MAVQTATQIPDSAPAQAAAALPGAGQLPGFRQFHIDLEREYEPLFGVGVPFRYTVLHRGEPRWSGTFCALDAANAADGVYDCIAETLRYDPAVVIEIRGDDGDERLLARRTSTQPPGARLPGAKFNVCESFQTLAEAGADGATARKIRARVARRLGLRARLG